MDWIAAWIGTVQGDDNCPNQPDSTQGLMRTAIEALYHYNTDDYWLEMGGERISEVETETDFYIAVWRRECPRLS